MITIKYNNEHMHAQIQKFFPGVGIWGISKFKEGEVRGIFSVILPSKF